MTESQKQAERETWRIAFDARHEFDVYPEHFMTGLCNEFSAGWQAAIASAGNSSANAAADVQDKHLRAIHTALHTQDNRITREPMFAVQERKRVCGIDAGYDPKIMWINEDCNAVGAEECAALEAQYQIDGTRPEGRTRVGYHEYWDFVTACFTEQGCKDYLTRNGHNLGETRIYAYGTYRNGEWSTVRDFLMSDRFASPLQPGASTTAAHAGLCETCGGRREVGGFVNAESGYQADPCPDCAAPADDARDTADIDTKALATAQEIALMWGRDRSQFVSRIQVAVREAMEWMRKSGITKAMPADDARDAARYRWQPIETAPLNVEVLVWREDAGVFMARKVAPCDVEAAESDDEDPLWLSEAFGWQEGDLTPTHWMLLPADPGAGEPQ